MVEGFFVTLGVILAILFVLFMVFFCMGHWITKIIQAICGCIKDTKKKKGDDE